MKFGSPVKLWFGRNASSVPGRPPESGVDRDVDRRRGPWAVEVRPLHLDARHVPARPRGDVEVVGRFVVVGVERRLEVLGARTDRSGVVVLVVEHVAR